MAPCKGKPCLTFKFDLSGHPFGTRLKSDALIFQSLSYSLVPLNIVLIECKKYCFRLQNTGDLFFLEKKPPAGLHHTESQSGDATTNCLKMDPCRPPYCMGPFSKNHNFTWGDMTLGPARVPKIIPRVRGSKGGTMQQQSEVYHQCPC